MEDRSRSGMALTLKWFGVWLVFTAALMLYGETAPSVLEPSLFGTLVCALTGLVCFNAGCLCAYRARNKPLPKQ
ncbi:MAG: hypothetical protein WDA11_07170 [Thiohalomonadaceae bacterium]